jgi:hypothetical protein
VDVAGTHLDFIQKFNAGNRNPIPNGGNYGIAGRLKIKERAVMSR